ncbi:hypothetical protein Ae201684P_020031 [Aphanomyces euteiches]|uniref:DDE Tnp4 domain-containing protein n=1 Tax=Aphanomyces euteiches TaxID=100861 RepID=A0A6G0XDU8_9STRA|nr:hypothetical protein Ae201684_005798 [Aphanomyces euteiches]KAH9078969.1 hypothetical protein Ae201684P_020031 [Aphanomyces euteiches]
MESIARESGVDITCAAFIDGSEIGAKWQACAPPGMFIYGDPAYPLRDWLISPYKGSKITAPQSRFNSKMSSVRVSVAWCFGEVLRYWAFLDFKKKLKVFLSPVAKLYLIGVFFTNCQGNQTSRSFHLVPPPLERYLNQ